MNADLWRRIRVYLLSSGDAVNQKIHDAYYHYNNNNGFITLIFKFKLHDSYHHNDKGFKALIIQKEAFKINTHRKVYM